MQRVRVGPTNGLGVTHLARKHPRHVGILGSGWHAGAHLMAVTTVRDIETIRCFSPTRAKREAFCTEMTAALGVKVTPVERPEDAIKGADIAMCASNTIDPIFFARWLEPGMHLTSIKRPEIETEALKRCDVLVLHSHDPAPQHLHTKGVVVPEIATDRGWKVASGLDV